jgi:hypothetical protein
MWETLIRMTLAISWFSPIIHFHLLWFEVLRSDLLPLAWDMRPRRDLSPSLEMISAGTRLFNRSYSWDTSQKPQFCVAHRMWLRGEFKRPQIGGLDLWEPVYRKLRPKRQHCSFLYVLLLKSHLLTCIRSPVSFESGWPEVQAWQVAQIEEDKQR